jgi:hypothetical protein
MNCYGMLKTNFQPQAAEITGVRQPKIFVDLSIVFLANTCALA